jgi:uncharacterized membrane protein
MVGGGSLVLYGLSRESLAGVGLALLGGALVYRGVTGHCSLYESLGVSTAPRRGRATAVPAGQGVRLETRVTINRTPSELFRFWRNFANLPRFMSHLEAVDVRDNRRSHWVARGPMRRPVSWDAEVYNERPDEMIAWRSLPGSQVETAGSVHFYPTPGGRGAEVHVNMKYNPPGGKLGVGVAWLFGQSAEQEIAEDLQRFQRIMETGEIPAGTGHPVAHPTAQRGGSLDSGELRSSRRDPVLEASEESFPASDPPSWTTGE